MKLKCSSFRWFAGIVLMVAVILGSTPAPWCAEADYYGIYAGTFSGGDEGVWIGVLSDDSLAHLFMSYSTKYEYGDGGNVYYDGEAGRIGMFSGTSLKGNEMEVDIDASDQSVSGSWSNTPYSGTLAGGIIENCSAAGSYSGTISGDVSGTMAGTIAANGTATITATVEGASFKMLGACHPDGYLMGYGIDPLGYIVGIVGRISDSEISGEWESETGDTGTFAASSSSGGGGDGGGCFILGLMAD